MTLSFETKTSVFTENAELLGDIEEESGGGWTFTAAVEMPLSADECIQIGEYIKALNERPNNEKPNKKLISDAKYIIEAFHRGSQACDYWREISDWFGDVNGVVK